jgi:hypothetical protein
VVRLSSDVLDYLASSDFPKQVLVTVKPRFRPLASPGRGARLASYEQAAEQNRHTLIGALRKAQERDRRVQFHPLAVVDQIAVKAPPAFIVEMAKHPDVADIVLDEPEKVLDDPPGDKPRGSPGDVDV